MNTYVIEAVRFSGLSLILMNLSIRVYKLNYKGLNQLGWISLGDTLQSRADLVL